MTKTEAIKIFGSTTTALAKAVGVTRSAVSQWPEQLRPDQIDRVVGAGVRLGRITVSGDGEITFIGGAPDEVRGRLVDGRLLLSRRLPSHCECSAKRGLRP